mgnify:FL=1
MRRYLKIHASDNVWVALRNLAAGERIDTTEGMITLPLAVNTKHKFAEKHLAVGEEIRMYGVIVGKATKNIQAGEPITVFNVQHAVTPAVLRELNLTWTPPDVTPYRERTFQGYHRSDGKVGVANYWLVIPLVFCENRNINMIREALVEQLGYHKPRAYTLNVSHLIDRYRAGASAEVLLEEDILVEHASNDRQRLFENVDGIKFLTHEGGCGGTRQDSDALCALLAGYLNNANVAGATVLSLGCQNAQVRILEEAIERINPRFDKPLYVLSQQESKSEPSFVADAVRKTFAGLVHANRQKRATAPISKLIVGLECGGSDGFSGISANPVVGHLSDMLVALGGAPVLAEFPELNGVEQHLVDRSVSLSIAEKFLRLMKTYAERAKQVGSGFDMNPSPGNIKDGLITDAMKSAGAAKKGGTSPVTAVLDYTEQVTKAGLHLLCTPGNDVESTTALAASGCTLLLFTTGLGTPTGNPIAPTIKVSSNTPLFDRMRDIIDVNAGTVITGEDTLESKANELMEFVLRVASGEVVPQAVRLQQEDFIPWKRGVSL